MLQVVAAPFIYMRPSSGVSNLGDPIAALLDVYAHLSNSKFDCSSFSFVFCCGFPPSNIPTIPRIPTTRLCRQGCGSGRGAT